MITLFFVCLLVIANASLRSPPIDIYSPYSAYSEDNNDDGGDSSSPLTISLSTSNALKTLAKV